MQNHRFFFRGKFLFVLLLIFILTGCDVFGSQAIPSTGGSFPTITLVPTITPIPTVTPIPDLPTYTPMANLSILPTLPNPLLYDGSTQSQPSGSSGQPVAGQSQPAASSTPQPPPTPTDTPLPVGQLPGKVLALLPSQQGLWVMYPDGTHATLVTNDPILHLTISPSGWVAAYVTNNTSPDASYQQPFGYTLKVITLYNDKIYTVTSLDPPGISANSPSDALDSAFQSISAYDRGAMAWSPDSGTLAFTSSHEAPSNQPASSDIYLYRLASNSISRFTHLQLSEGPGHPYELSWAPLGQRLFFAVANGFGNNSGNLMAGAWVNGLDGSSVQVAPGQSSAGENFIAWLNSGSILMSTYNTDCGNQNVRKINLSTGEATVFWPGCYKAMTYDRLRDQILFSVTPDIAAPGGANQPGLYLVTIPNNQVNSISNHGFERILSGDPFGQDRASWYGFNRQEGLFVIQRTGQVNPIFTGPPFDGSAGVDFRPLFRLNNTNEWLWTGDGLYLCKPGSQPQKVISLPVDSLTVSPADFGLYFFLSPDPNTGIGRLYAVRARDWQPFIVDQRIINPGGIDWTR